MPPAVIDLELCWGTLSQLSVVDQITTAAAAGFRYVTISPSQYRQYVAEHANGASSIRSAMSAGGVKAAIVDCLMSEMPGSPDAGAVPDQYRDMFAITADDCFDILDELGGETLQVAHFLGQPVALQAMIDAIGHLRDRARARGYHILVEFMPGTGIPDFPSAAAIVTALGTDHVGVVFDTWHFARTGGEEAELTELTPGMVGSLQLNDCPIPAREMAQLGYVPMSDRLLPGDGVSPLERVLAAIFTRSGPVRAGIEVFSSQLRAMAPEDAARLALSKTAAVVEGAGATVA